MSHTETTEAVEKLVEEFLKLQYEPEHVVESGNPALNDGGEKCWCKTEHSILLEGGSWLGRFEIKHNEQRKVLSAWLRTTLEAKDAEREKAYAEGYKQGYTDYGQALEDRGMGQL